MSDLSGCCVVWIAAALTLSETAWSQPYPVKPIRLIVQGAASSAPDVIVRPVAQRVSQAVGQPVVVENRPGGGGAVAAQIAVNAPSDGYTFLLAASGTISIVPFLMKKPPFAVKDLAPVTLLAIAPLILTAHPSIRATSPAELIALAKSRPNQLLIGTPGVGTIQHLTVEMLNRAAGISLAHVPFKSGAAAVIGALGAQVQLALTAIPAVLAHIESSRLRAIAVTSAKRSPALPSVPTFNESGVAGFAAATWYGVYAPRKTAANAIDKMYGEMRKATDSPDVREAATREGVELEVTGPRALAEFQRIDMARWQKIIRELNIVLD